LTAIDVSPSNSVYVSADGVLFCKAADALIACPPGKVGAYAIPDGIASIGVAAFRDCRSLTRVAVPASTTNIGFVAFSNCANLVRVYFAGNAPASASDVFHSTPATIYHRPDATGWGYTYCDRPTAVWADDAAISGEPVPVLPTAPQP
jgi:hypothetical protein